MCACFRVVGWEIYTTLPVFGVLVHVPSCFEQAVSCFLTFRSREVRIISYSACGCLFYRVIFLDVEKCMS